MHALRTVLLALVMGVTAMVSAKGGRTAERTSASVECSRASAFIKLQLHSDHRIGKVTIEVRDLDGRTWYKEEGKALTNELVRLLDKGVFPKGEMRLLITGRDLRIEQLFVVR
ncbi:MAG: hypothetical protein H6595_11920 [Flavobacteriales bacterium]|nr:hypothetical protein [Flavobacteriales bacterium]MCB9168168.1 hypothetical protein [Flavobacteriales bacterium]MCB9194267.1 hypothetical protein [Flavobacteriales bacterium]